MEISKLLNDCDRDDVKAGPPRSDQFRRLPSLTSTFPTFGSHQHNHHQQQHHHHHLQRNNSLASLTPLESALPPLSRSSSDYSDSVDSPITPPLATPEATPRLPSDLDSQRHRPADLQRPEYQHHYGQHRLLKQPVRKSSFGFAVPMDPFGPNDYLAGIPNQTSFQQPRLPHIQPAPGQLPLPQTQLSPVPSLASLDQPSYPSNSRSAPKVSTKKNSYPCPVAKQYNCSEHFTTSGHAARHAKKHTGKKDAICPECQKAFTRKDNMEQHRRTHSNNRGASKSGSSEESRQRKVMKLQQQQQHQQKKEEHQQQQQRKAQELPNDTLTTPSSLEFPPQSMSAALIPPHPAAAPANHLQMAMLDPQLRTDVQPMLSDFGNANMANTVFWEAQQMQMPYMQNSTLPSLDASASHHRPRVSRSSYRDELQNQLRPAPSFGSPSASPGSEFSDPQSPSKLDTLAFAASKLP